MGSDLVFGFLLTLPALASYAPFMPRRLRIEYEDAIYHVMTRGNARQDIVHDDDDRRRLLVDLERVVERSQNPAQNPVSVHLFPGRKIRCQFCFSQKDEMTLVFPPKKMN
jgi:hypothetical protein